MKNVSIGERLSSYLQAKFPAARQKGVREDDPLLERGIIDSMGVLDLVEFIEQEFQIKVSDDDLVPDNFETLARIEEYIRKCRNSAPSVP
jgi:acyl carrier protein